MAPSTFSSINRLNGHFKPIYITKSYGSYGYCLRTNLPYLGTSWRCYSLVNPVEKWSFPRLSKLSKVFRDLLVTSRLIGSRCTTGDNLITSLNVASKSVQTRGIETISAFQGERKGKKKEVHLVVPISTQNRKKGLETLKNIGILSILWRYRLVFCARNVHATQYFWRTDAQSEFSAILGVQSTE
mgnify:CR=1 FL=1